MTRSYESSGPDVKIRGTAHHIGEKYLQLARDAQSSGDPVTAESYLQHAEHYFRLIALAQAQQGASGYQRQSGDAPIEDYDENDDFAAVPDRFASPLERIQAQPAFAPQVPGAGPQPSADRAFFPAGQPERGHQDRGQERQPQGPRPAPYQEARAYDHGGAGGNGQDQDRGPERGQSDRSAQERQPREAYGPRDQGGDRDDRGPRRNRDFRNESPREPREPRGALEPAEPASLPAFITAPVRAVADPADQSAPALALETAGAAAETHAGGDRDAGEFHLRPRRRRRVKADADADNAERPEEPGQAQSSAKDTIAD